VVSEYKANEEMVALYADYAGLLKLRDRYVARNASYKKTKRAALEAERARLSFWRMVNDVYPELQSYHLRYEDARCVLSVVDEERGGI
jgi:hypothetical protein